MSVGFPINTIIVIVVVMVAVSGAAWLSLSHALEHVPLTAHARRAWRWGAAVVLSTWLLVRFELAVNPPDNAVQFFPYSIVFVGLGALIGVGALLVSPVFRQIIRAVPQTWLIGIHAIRLAGFVFLALADMGRLPMEFALPAGYGDMAVGLQALVSVYALVNPQTVRSGACDRRERFGHAGLCERLRDRPGVHRTVRPPVRGNRHFTAVSQLCAHRSVIRRTRLRATARILALPAVFAAAATVQPLAS